MCSEYFRDPQPDKFREGWLMTGDVAKIDPEQYLIIADRSKDLVKSGGEWISSVDMENALMAHPAVLEATVIGVAHPKWEERPLAIVVLREAFRGSVDREDLRKHLLKSFAKWQLPDEILFVDAFDKTSVGKSDKKTLRKKYAHIYDETSGG